MANHARQDEIRAAARNFKLHHKNFERWLKDDLTVARPAYGNKPGAGRKISYGQDIEEKLIEWVLIQQDKQVCVSVQSLQVKAMVLIREANPDFKASHGWAQKFMKRHSPVLQARTSLSQMLPADIEAKLASFHDFIMRQHSEHDFEKELIGNMAETPVFFDIVPNKTIDQQGVRLVLVRKTGGDKSHIIVVLTCTAAGQVPPTIIIFKGKRQLNLRALPGFVVAVQKKKRGCTRI